jgi:hypothetical protein
MRSNANFDQDASMKTRQALEGFALDPAHRIKRKIASVGMSWFARNLFQIAEKPLQAFQLPKPKPV